MANRFFSKHVPLFGSTAMLLLCTVFFFLPFALRGARLGMDQMKNNVADWLPDHYEETKELKEFRRYFDSGDQFVVVSGPWCKEGDPAYTNLFRKIEEESLQGEKYLIEAQNAEELQARRKGDELGLLYSGNYHEDFGEQQEKWLQGRDGQWYFINRKGELFRWKGENNIVSGFKLMAERGLSGKNKAEGKFICSFGAPPDDANGIENPFYKDPQKLCCRPFKSVISGPDVFEQMAGPDGTLRIGAFGENDKSTIEAKMEAHKRLTGALFGPTPAASFNWTFESLLQHVDQARQTTLRSIPIYRETFDDFVATAVDEKFEGKRDSLLRAKSSEKLELWYSLWYEFDLEPPPRQTCLVVTLNEPIIDEMARAVGRPIMGKPRGRILELATGECGIAPDNVRMGGPPSDNVAIDEEGSSTLVRLAGLSLVIGLALAYLSFGSVRVAIMLFFVGGVAAIASLSYVWFAGETMDAILMSMPSLVYVLALSSAVHIVNYYRDACFADGPQLAVEKAVSHSWFPCTLAAFTTSLGLFSLTTSNLTPIFKFGLFSGIAVLATVVLLFTYLPSALWIWKPGYMKRTKADLAKESTLSSAVGRVWSRIGDWVIGHHWLVSSVSIALLIFFAIGVTQIQTSVQLLKLFDKDAKILHDYRWLEENLGELVPADIATYFDQDQQKEPFQKAELERLQAIELAKHPEGTTVEEAMEGVDIVFSPEHRLANDLKYSMLERVELSRRIRQKLEYYFGPDGMGIVGSGMSTDVFTPLYRIDSQEKSTYRKQFSSALVSKQQQMLEQDYYAMVGYSNVDREERAKDLADPTRAGREMWRVSIRLAALNNVDYGQFVNDLKSVVEPILSAYRYRTKVLKTLQQELGEKSLTESKVLILARDPDTHFSDVRAEVAKGASVADLIDQTYLFSDTLQDLMENRGITLRDKNKFYRWIDPDKAREYPDKYQDLYQPEKFSEFVKAFDCVVLVEDDELFDVEMISSSAKSLVDCRGHVFEVDQRTKLPMPGMLTAKQIKDQPEFAEDVDVAAIYTGIVPIVYKAQRSLLQSLIESIGLAFVMISCVMMLLLRDWKSRFSFKNVVNIRGGMISMLPNVFPVVIVFGFLGHMNRVYGGTVDGFLVDIGSMMTASVAMGVAVDDTIHFLNWYRTALNEGHERKSAIKLAYDRVATAMTQTTLIGGLGLSAFALSTFTPTQRFGVLMFFLLLMALVGDLILLPALLAGPLGKYFGKERPRDQVDESGGDSPIEPTLRLIGDAAAPSALQQSPESTPEVVLPDKDWGNDIRRIE